MITQLKEFNVGFQDYEKLFLFIGTINRYNGDRPVGMCGELVPYFQYRWEHDKNIHLLSSEGYDILSQVPHDVQKSLFEAFMFNKCFMAYYKSSFDIPFIIPIKRKVMKLKKFITKKTTSFLDN